MNLVRLLSAFATASAVLATVHAQDEPAPTTPAPTTAAPTEPPPGNVEPPKDPATTPAAPTPTPAPGTSKPTSAGGKPSSPDEYPLNKLKQKDLGFEYQMPMVRVVQARVQGDEPVLMNGRFVSKYGKGDFKHSYMSAMDTVNTASVEGALMYVQAEGIDVLARAKSERCRRKNDMQWVVFYEILIAQSNETIAQYRDRWNVPEYGHMQPMDNGKCTPETGDEFPPECLQFNGEDGQPNLGPFVGAGLKNNNDKAPYPDTYWFSFPHTCPLKFWGDKEDLDSDCRKNARKGLCDIGKAPDGVECTFAYDILGWVPIDDVVGITSLEDDNGNKYKDFKEWCEASEDHIEFKRGPKNEKVDGLEFWDEPLDETANAKRAQKVITTYDEIVAGEFTSGLISEDNWAKFKPLPKPDELEAINPPCYKTVPKCNEGFGCKRRGFSQLCIPCTSAEAGCTTNSNFKFPALAKAPTTLSEDETSSVPNPELGANGRIDGTQNTKAPDSSANAVVGLPLATLAVAAASLFTA